MLNKIKFCRYQHRYCYSIFATIENIFVSRQTRLEIGRNKYLKNKKKWSHCLRRMNASFVKINLKKNFCCCRSPLFISFSTLVFPFLYLVISRIILVFLFLYPINLLSISLIKIYVVVVLNKYLYVTLSHIWSYCAL